MNKDGLIDLGPGFHHIVDFKRLNDQSIIVDAGACIAGFPEIIRGYEQTKKCKIYCIECNRKNNEIIIGKNLDNVILIKAALVGNNFVDDQIEFIEYKNLREWGNVKKLYVSEKREEAKDREIYMVKALKINDIFTQLNINHIDYLKMDVEGAENDIFSTVSKDIMDNIFQISMEYHCSYEDIVKNLKKFGFEVTINHKSQEIYGTKFN